MVEFGLMHVEGFASILKETFNWGLGGLNIIQAPNGYGKTKFINALYWSLYGETLSGSAEMWEFLRPKDFMGTKVETNFLKDGDKIKVIRCKEYIGKVEGAKGKNRLIVKKNGEELKIKDKKDIQKELQFLIGYSSDLFKNSIIFGQKLKRLISETGPNKKKIFDEAFEVLYIEKAKQITDVELSRVSDLYNRQLILVNNISKDLDNIREKLEREKEIVGNFEKNKETNITEQNFYITQNNEKIDILDNEYAAIDIYTDELLEEEKEKLKKLGNERDIISEIAKLKLQIDQNQKILNNLKYDFLHIPEVCSRCGKSYTPTEKLLEKIRIQKELQDSLLLIKKLKGNLLKSNSIYSRLSKLKESIISLENNKILLEENKKERAKLVEDNKNREKTVESLKSQILENKIDLYTRDLRTIEDNFLYQRGILLKIYKTQTTKKWLINEPLSNHGLKAYIFETMLDKINDALVEYSQYIGFQVVFDIDMESHNKNLVTYVYNGINIVPYEDLSGGQQQSVDVISAFAIHDVVNEGRECNLLIMDEIFESLDNNNIEIVSELIQDKAKSKALYLITHLNAFSPINSNLIKIAFKNGFTRLSA